LVVDSLPLNSTHKPDRRLLTEMVRGARPHASAR
jgi:acyl-CoA synthetase (AMP-forming)/AMP-acid ligase II